MNTAHTIKTVTLGDKTDAICESGVTQEYRHWFGSLIVNHLTMFIWSNDLVHRIARVFVPTSDTPIAFCYYYINQDTNHCEIFGVFVDESLRRQRVAENLISSAILGCVRNGCESFAFRFLSPIARNGGLVQSLRNLFNNEIRNVKAQLYYPDVPYVETIGG